MTANTHSTGTNFDPWFSNYADRTAGLSASEVRALFAVASRPEVVSLAGGMPYVSAIPAELMTEVMGRVIADQGPVALQYGSGQGHIKLREHILDVMNLEGISGSVDNVVVTTGSQQALELMTKLFINPGDVILAEAPSYVGALGVFRSYQATIEHVLIDEHGLIPQALREAVERVRARGGKIKFLYTVPNFHNPAGINISWERRVEILEICQSNNILILEDNPYGQLYFNEAPPRAIRSLDEDGVVYLGSFSKTFAPGFRAGWALAPHAIREKLILAAEAAVLSPSQFTQLTVSEYMSSFDWKAQIAMFRGIYRERKEAMNDALSEYLPKLSWNNPDGGFYIWLKLTEGLDSRAMLPRAVKELVAYTPGTAFYADGTGKDYLRLAFCYPTPDRVLEGIKRLARVIHGETELLETFGPSAISKAPESQSRVVSPPPNIG